MISLEKGKKLVERMEEENCLKQSEINTINQKVNRIQQNYENKLKDVNKLRDDTKRINKEKKRRTEKIKGQVENSETSEISEVLLSEKNRKLRNKKTRNNISEISEVSEFSICHFSIFFPNFFSFL